MGTATRPESAAPAGLALSSCCFVHSDAALARPVVISRRVRPVAGRVAGHPRTAVNKGTVNLRTVRRGQSPDLTPWVGCLPDGGPHLGSWRVEMTQSGVARNLPLQVRWAAPPVVLVTGLGTCGLVVLTASGALARMRPRAESPLASPAAAGVPKSAHAPGTVLGAPPALSQTRYRRLNAMADAARHHPDLASATAGCGNPRTAKQDDRKAGAFGSHSGQRQTRGPRAPFGLKAWGCSLRASWA